MSDENKTTEPQSVYDFTVKDTYGNDVPLSKYKDNVLVIVNIASLCSLTGSNYKGLTELNQKYKDKGKHIEQVPHLYLVQSLDGWIKYKFLILGVKVLAFPCNQFAKEMPEKDGEEMVCHLRDKKADIGDLFQTVDVNGESAAPLYKFLKTKQGGFLGDGIKWNFTKFLVDKNGQPVDRFAPTTSVSSVEKKIEELLKNQSQ